MQIRQAPEGILVQWNNINVSGEYYTLLKSTSQVGGFEPVLQYTQLAFYLDEAVNLYEKGKTYFYKLEVCDEAKTVIDTIGPVHAVYNQPDGIARVVINESKILLERVMGNKPYQLLLKKRSGIHCPECFNPVTKRVKFHDCSKCSGTGILQGYHKPTKIFLSKDFSYMSEFNSMMDGENVKLSTVDAWTSNFPVLAPGDVFVDYLDNRFRITNVNPRMKSGALIRQILQLVPLDRGDSVYQVEVKWHG